MEEDKTPSAVKVYASSEVAEVPFVDLLTWTFGNPSYDLEKPLFIDASAPDRYVSYKTALTTVRKLIGGLKANGLEPGDTVCLHSANNINYPLVFLAVIGAGGRFAGSNPHYTTSELTHLLTLSEVKYIITEEESWKNMQGAAESVGISPENIFMFDTSTTYESSEFRSWKVLLESAESGWITFDDEHLAKTTVAALMSTSGTTGLPKAAQCSHYSQVAQSVILAEDKKPYEVIRLLCLPQFHAFNAPLSLIAPLREGHTTYIVKRYNPNQFVEYLRTLRPTETTMVNPIIYKLLELTEDERSSIQSLRAIWCGGVPLAVSVQNTFREILHPDAIVKQVWGLTEVGWATTLKYPEKDSTGSAGRLLPGVEARIIDAKGNDLLDEEAQGEILLRGPSLMLGYLKNEASTKATIQDGWLHTGDVGYQCGGKWYIVDRIKELIKVRGWQVSPAEIETCLFTHPAVADVAVIGVDFGDDRGELPRAYVVFNPSHASSTTDKEIQQYLLGKLSRYKALDGGVRRVDSLPRGSTGKVLKNVFKEAAKQEVLEARMRAAAIADGGSGENTPMDSEEERNESLEHEKENPSLESAAVVVVEEHENAPVGIVDVQDNVTAMETSLESVGQSCSNIPEGHPGLVDEEDKMPETSDATAEELAEICGTEGSQDAGVGISAEGIVESETLVPEMKNFAGTSMADLPNEATTEGTAEENVKLEASGANMESAVLPDVDIMSKLAATMVVTEKKEVDT